MDVEHIRWRVEAMLGLWETLDPDEAAIVCQHKLRRLLAYLATADDVERIQHEERDDGTTQG